MKESRGFSTSAVCRELFKAFNLVFNIAVCDGAFFFRQQKERGSINER